MGRGVAVVTGGSAGVGRAVVRRLAERGFDVAVVARESERLHEAAREVRAAGLRSIAASTDVSAADEVEEAARRAEDELGPVDVWINNAMTSIFAPVWEVSAQEIERVTRVTYLGYVHGTLSALRRMRPRGHGVIVQVGSALAYRGIPLQSAYCGAKHAVRGFSESVRTELLHERSRVEIVQVHLPALNTPQFDWVESRLPRRAQPVPPIYQPEVAARAIVWAAEHPRREVWVGESTAATVLADRVASGLLDRYVARTGFGSQQTDEAADPNRVSNLWRPVAADVAARGRFEARSFGRTLVTPPWSRRVAAAVVGGVALVRILRRRAS